MHVRADDRLPCPPASVVETAELAGEVAVSGDPREPYGRIVHEQRRAWVAGQPGKFYAVVWEDRDEGQWELDRRIGEAVAAAGREPFNAMLPEGAARPVTPELLAALVALWQTWWNKVAILEGDDPGHSLISFGDVIAMDEAAQAVEALLYPPAAEGTEGGTHD